MAYKKSNRNYSSKKSYRKKSYQKRRTPGIGGMAERAFKLASKVAREINAETKEVEVQVTSTTPTYNGVVASISDTTQGVGLAQHEGQSIKWTDCVIRGYVAAGNTAEFLRLIIFVDNENVISSGFSLPRS